MSGKVEDAGNAQWWRRFTVPWSPRTVASEEHGTPAHSESLPMDWDTSAKPRVPVSIPTHSRPNRTTVPLRLTALRRPCEQVSTNLARSVMQRELGFGRRSSAINSSSAMTEI